MAKKKAEKDGRRSGSEIPNRRTGFRVQVELDDKENLSVKVTATAVGTEGERVLTNGDGSIATDEKTGAILKGTKEEPGEVVERAVTAHTQDITEYLDKPARDLLSELLGRIAETVGPVCENTAKAFAGQYDALKQGKKDPNTIAREFRAALEMSGINEVAKKTKKGE